MKDSHLHEADHRTAWSLIPWLVNGTIEDEERREVERHLAACHDCREQYALERRSVTACKDSARTGTIRGRRWVS